MRPQAKCEVRWEDESSNPVDAGASASNKLKIRVLNHKDYKTWKVRISTIYPYSIITGFFEPVLVFWEDAGKPIFFFAYDNASEASHALMKGKP